MDDASPSSMDYASYLALDELLSLQRTRSSPTHPDELLFIIVHQTSELWFKLMLHEMDALIACLQAGDDGAGDALGAVAALKRLNGLVGIVSAQLAALETLPPQRFAEFRGHLGASSGSQSAQFRALEAASGMRDPHFLHLLREAGAPAPIVERALQRPTLEELFAHMLSARGLTLEDVYARGEHAPLFMLAEALLEYEQGFARWRFLHVQLVERIIGPDTGGTGGTLGARYLQRTVQQRFFPRLWAVRARFYGANAGPGGTGA